MQRMHEANGRDFTLIELLVVIAIIAILAAMLMPALESARQRARQLTCVNRLRHGGLVFTFYFNDYGGSIPPLSTTGSENWGGYRYGNWYPAIRPYATLRNPDGSGSFRSDRPVELVCPHPVSGVRTYGYPHYLYAMNWRLRWKRNAAGKADVTLSYRVSELRNPTDTGLLFGNASYGDSIYYMSIKKAFVGRRVAAYPGRWYTGPMHDQLGIGAAYMDGHAEFCPGDVDEIANNYYAPDLPWAHRKFWGVRNDGSYITRYYAHQP